jgi:glutaredoxin-like YruB-family protein
MKRHLKIILLIIIFLVFDKYGNIHFTDSLTPGLDAELKKIKPEKTKIEKPVSLETPTLLPKTETKKQGNDYKTKKAYSNVKVTMYMTTWCGYCRKAREYLNSLGVSLTEYDIEHDKAGKAEMKEKTGGGSGVPVIDIEGTIIRGFAPEEIKAEIEKKRAL